MATTQSITVAKRDTGDEPRPYGEGLDVRKELRIDEDMETRINHQRRRSRQSFNAYVRQAILEKLQRDESNERALRRETEDDA